MEEIVDTASDARALAVPAPSVVFTNACEALVCTYADEAFTVLDLNWQVATEERSIRHWAIRVPFYGVDAASNPEDVAAAMLRVLRDARATHGPCGLSWQCKPEIGQKLGSALWTGLFVAHIIPNDAGEAD